MKGSLALVSLSLYLAFTEAAPSPDVTQCSPASLVCCRSLELSNTPSVAVILGLLGIPEPDPPVLVGITCDPVSIIGLGGTQWCVPYFEM